ncbi:unnamed protein product, partial [Hapterophycus canaliculatus]
MDMAGGEDMDTVAEEDMDTVAEEDMDTAAAVAVAVAVANTNDAVESLSGRTPCCWLCRQASRKRVARTCRFGRCMRRSSLMMSSPPVLSCRPAIGSSERGGEALQGTRPSRDDRGGHGRRPHCTYVGRRRLAGGRTQVWETGFVDMLKMEAPSGPNERE